MSKTGFCEKQLKNEADSEILINITQERLINIYVLYGEYQGSSCLYEQLTTLYDLIKAGLVEKI